MLDADLLKRIDVLIQDLDPEVFMTDEEKQQAARERLAVNINAAPMCCPAYLWAGTYATKAMPPPPELVRAIEQAQAQKSKEPAFKKPLPRKPKPSS
ncbi:hypothetical protein [Candidatus Berkiella aquae]|uniref:Uncharacterized protein n=1 Tax=Candidatus Berkiella aquae TaxID=295108 RepID=A0A0Q9YMB4_9GAMM|nr:hypothetical protein [Candidatus Berkiella aquae]MCS5710485.1 hypothetical protein [Candidatus Berkiella aquae]